MRNTEMKKSYKFTPFARYVTRGVETSLPFEIQMIMWAMIDRMVKSGFLVDYLQVFTIDCHQGDCLIKHKQECPDYIGEVKRKILEEEFECHELKVFVIDDETHSTMLLASEY